MVTQRSRRRVVALSENGLARSSGRISLHFGTCRSDTSSISRCLPGSAMRALRMLPIRAGRTSRSGVEHAHHVDLRDGHALHDHGASLTAPLLEPARAIQLLGGSVALGDSQLHLQ